MVYYVLFPEGRTQQATAFMRVSLGAGRELERLALNTNTET
jgi:hypothetical protein